MTKVIIWHNPRCSKSRQALAQLQAQGIEPIVRRYLEDSPSEQELRDVLGKLAIAPIDMVRPKEKAFGEQGLNKQSSDSQLLAAMARAPILIERPIVIAGEKAAIGRPPEAILGIL